jgi:predicted metal-dependent hydrolase
VPVSSRTNSPELALRNKLTKWYKQVAMRHLELRVRNQAGKMLENSLTPKIKVRDYKRRWGSCDHRGDLSFNWRIIMAPERVMDYVVVHELAHLQEFNHSRRFWNIVEQEMSDWRDQQRWLSDNGSLLYRF